MAKDFSASFGPDFGRDIVTPPPGQISSDVYIAWDPEVLSEEEYAAIVVAIGNAVRTHGGQGIKLVRPTTLGATVGEGVTA